MNINMSKYINAEKFIKKFEKMIDDIPASVDSGAGYVIDEVYKIFDSLQQEKPQVADASKMEQPEVDLENEINAVWNPRFNLGWDEHSCLTMNRAGFESFARHFAEWQKSQMLKEAVEADVNTYKDLAAGKSWAEFVVEMPTSNLGNKVRLIVLPMDE